jgi:hypothetical protein
VVEAVQANGFPPGWGKPATACALNYSMLPSGLVACAIQAVNDAGGNITFGVTKDLSSCTLGLYVKGQRSEPLYIGTAERMAERLNGLIDYYGSKSEDIRQLFGLGRE